MSRVILLAPEGKRTTVAAAFEEALSDPRAVLRVSRESELTRKLQRSGPATEIVVIDYELPGAGDTLRRLRASRPELAIVALTPSESLDASTTADAVERGATDTLESAEPIGPRVETLLRKLSRLRRLAEETARLHEAVDARYHIVGESPQMKAVMERIRRVAKVPRPVLVMGERGTGKELVARAIHREGGAERPFVAVNCAALPDTLLESELFGHEKGAFTGAAHASRGRFEQASGGTLFLDEIGNMSLPFQQKILRVVEYKRFTRVGGNQEIRVATRIIAATNAHLEDKLQKGQFLHDLYDRLAFEVIRVPPLREREGEIEVLAQYFLNQFMKEVPAFEGKRLSAKAIDLLHTYAFPGNVRELKNIVERAVYRDTTNELTPEDIGLLADHAFQAPGGSFKEKVAAFERQLLADALRNAKGNQAEAARGLGMRYHQLRHYLKKHGLGEEG